MPSKFKNREEYEKWRTSKLDQGRGGEVQLSEKETLVIAETEPGNMVEQNYGEISSEKERTNLTICKDCGKPVSRRADRCPHCGAPMESMSSKTEGKPQRVVVTPTKSMGVSIILTVLFGPLGMLYSTIWGGIIMGVLSLVVGLLTFGLGLIITWPICIIWAAVATSLYNQKLLLGQRQY